jgi:hypothetical protein
MRIASLPARENEAVVFDIDETVLDNSKYAAWMVWYSPAIPGAATRGRRGVTRKMPMRFPAHSILPVILRCPQSGHNRTPARRFAAQNSRSKSAITSLLKTLDKLEFKNTIKLEGIMKTGKLIILLTAAMLAACATQNAAINTARTQQKASADDFLYTVDGIIVIYGYNGLSDTVNIPAVIDNFPVKAITGFAFNEQITSIVIPDTVEIIGDGKTGAFEGCTNLKTVVLPSKLKTIGEKMFSGCTSLEIIAIPNSVTRSSLSGKARQVLRFSG